MNLCSGNWITILLFHIAESQTKPHDVLPGSCTLNSDKSSPISEVYQAEDIDKREMLDLQTQEYVSSLFTKS